MAEFINFYIWERKEPPAGKHQKAQHPAGIKRKRKEKKQMKQGINKALALFLAVVLAFSPIAAAFGDSMTVYATEASTESETGRSRSAADLHEALETAIMLETVITEEAKERLRHRNIFIV